ncbi:hypothetical protein MYX82_08080 [Acidobacteria bacterium AH-259-D05]|nr:hypothetical protein [Acidobacteria bacterium AH-259-D05]
MKDLTGGVSTKDWLRQTRSLEIKAYTEADQRAQRLGYDSSAKSHQTSNSLKSSEQKLKSSILTAS